MPLISASNVPWTATEVPSNRGTSKDRSHTKLSWKCSLSSSPLATVGCIQEGCVPSSCCLLVSRTIHQNGLHPILAYGIQDERRRGGFTACHLDLAYRFSWSVALAHQPIHKVPHSLPTAASLLLPLGTVSTTFLTVKPRSRLASTNTELPLLPLVL